MPLMSEAAFKGDVATMERLVAKGASVNQHDQVKSRSVQSGWLVDKNT